MAFLLLLTILSEWGVSLIKPIQHGADIVGETVHSLIEAIIDTYKSQFIVLRNGSVVTETRLLA